MSINNVDMYNIDSHVAEIYGTYWEIGAEDVDYLRVPLRECGARRQAIRSGV